MIDPTGKKAAASILFAECLDDAKESLVMVEQEYKADRCAGADFDKAMSDLMFNVEAMSFFYAWLEEKD